MFLTADHRRSIARKAPDMMRLIKSANTPEEMAAALSGQRVLIHFAAGFDPLSARNRHSGNLPYLPSNQLQRTDAQGKYLLPKITLEGLVGLCQSPYVVEVCSGNGIASARTPWRGR